jgi:hypothetical protein
LFTWRSEKARKVAWEEAWVEGRRKGRARLVVEVERRSAL